MAQTSISEIALFAAIAEAEARMKAAEESDDPHEVVRQSDLVEAFATAAARIHAVTEADRDAHRRLHRRAAEKLAGHASGVSRRCEPNMWRVIEHLQQLEERLDEQDQQAAA